MILQSIRMAFTSIRQHKLRAFLTVLGIVIGVSSVVSVIAVGSGLKNSIADQVESFGTNLLQINPGRPFGDQQEDDQSSFNFAASLGASTLTEKDVEVVRQTPNVGAVSPAMLISGVLAKDGK
ncbi:ABC transporter permease, partial [Candidatus Microgenomates bacterium]|nr:ABC transporter permease [Candidatus Microgenomates bacterium]